MVLTECIQGAMNEILTQSKSQRSISLIHDLALAWYVLKNAKDTDGHGSLGSSLPSVVEDMDSI